MRINLHKYFILSLLNSFLRILFNEDILLMYNKINAKDFLRYFIVKSADQQEEKYFTWKYYFFFTLRCHIFNFFSKKKMYIFILIYIINLIYVHKRSNKLWNNLVSGNLAPSRDKCTEILLKLPAETEKKSILPHSTYCHPLLSPTLISAH